MSISIVINTDTPEDAREHMLALLGLTQKGTPWGEQPVPANDTVSKLIAFGVVPVRGVESVKNDAGLAENVAGDVSDVSDVPTTYTQRIQGIRERGQPSPGKARRTKAEIAEDEAADKADSSPIDATERELMADEEAGQAAISTGEERVGPEDDAETVEQDEADETAETEAAIEERPADKKLTHDDVRNALGAYVKQYGMAAAQADGPKVISLVCGEGKVKMSDIPDDQALLAKVVAGIDEMLRKNPFKRDKVA